MAKDSDSVLQQARARIDAIDDQLLELLSRRGELAHQVALGKQADAGGEVVYYRPEREAAVLRRLFENNRGPFSDQTITAVFREVISATLALEKPPRIAVSTVPGSISELAVVTQFGRFAQIDRFPSNLKALQAVGKTNDLAVIAIEDSVSGLFPEQLKMVIDSGLLPVAEVVIEGQCRVFATGSPDAKTPVEIDADAGIGSFDLLGDLPRQIISSGRYCQLLAQPVGDHLLWVNVDRSLDGWRIDPRFLHVVVPVSARFLVLGSQYCQPTGRDRTLLAVDTGGLSIELATIPQVIDGSVLLVSVDTGSNRWALIVEGHGEDQSVQALLAELSDLFSSVIVAGSWPVVTYRSFND